MLIRTISEQIELEMNLLSLIAKLLLTVTSISPILISFAIIFYIRSEWPNLLICLSICAFFLAICIVVIKQAAVKLETIKFTILKAEAADRENTLFLLVYVFPLFGVDFSQLNWEIWLPALAIFTWISATGYGYHFNPLLNMFGWHFYRVEASEGITFVLLTKKEIRNTSGEIDVCQLTEYIILDKGT